MIGTLEIITKKDLEEESLFNFDPISITIKIGSVEEAKFLYKALEHVNQKLYIASSGWSPWLDLQDFLKQHIIKNILK